MKSSTLRFLLKLSLGLLLACALRSADFTVFAAASLSDALKEIAATYEATSGDKVHFNLAASSLLARQIKEGAPADVFFSADEAKMDDLAKAGLLAAGTRHSLLSNTLVIVVPAGTTTAADGPAYLITAAVRHLALGETRSVPAGIYARQWLEKTGLWPQVEAKVVAVENVRACLAAVESGNADAGIVYRTDALLSKKVRIIHEVADTDGPKISYPVAVLKDSKQVEAAGKFATYLASPAALAVFARYGFTAAP
jgi:molybdate transport system substrate-binding protein